MRRSQNLPGLASIALVRKQKAGSQQVDTYRYHEQSILIQHTSLIFGMGEGKVPMRHGREVLTGCSNIFHSSPQMAS